MKDRTRMLTARPRSILLLVVILAALTLVPEGSKTALRTLPVRSNSAGAAKFCGFRPVWPVAAAAERAVP